MGEVVQFPTKKKEPWVIIFTEEQYNQLEGYMKSNAEHTRVMEAQLERIKKMSLWDRIFNWPY